MTPILQNSNIIQQWQGNQRLRLGCLLISAILCWLMYQSLVERTTEIKSSCQQQNTQIERLQKLADKDVWIERLQNVTRHKQEIKARLLSAESRGLAQAQVQTKLYTLLQQQEIKQRRVNVSPPVPLAKLSGVWQVEATLEGDYLRQPLVKILLELESAKYLVSVEHLEMNSYGKRKRFNMTIKVFCQL
jgi:hypothetical protein